MNNTQKNNGLSKEEETFLAWGKNTSSQVKPDKKLLTNILDQIKPVTSFQPVRNNNWKIEDTGRNSRFNNFINIINHMNKYIKILSGGAAVSVIIIALVFLANNDTVSPVTPANSLSQVQVSVGGENVDVDSLIADLNNIDASFNEPVINETDLSNGLINTNNYEIL